MAIDQLQHSLQTATRALRDGASEELIAAALCHDIATSISYENHGAIAAEILRPYLSHEICEIVRTHQQFQLAHYHEEFGRNPQARRRYGKRPWFGAAERFSDEWDQAAFDPDYDTLPLEYFEPLLEGVFAARHRRFGPVPAKQGLLQSYERSRWWSGVRRLMRRGKRG